MAIKSFRRGETTYTCRNCKKLTRNTGGDEISCRLCIHCFDLASIENFYLDNGTEEFLNTYANDVRRIFNERPELQDHFPELASALKNELYSKVNLEMASTILNSK